MNEIESIEVWKDVIGYAEFYQVSNMGRVRSLTHYNIGLDNVLRKFKGKIHTIQINIWGYQMVSLQKNSVQHFVSVHRLVANHFIPNPLCLPEVNHIKGIKTDNRSTELEWCTASENRKHSFRVLGQTPPVGNRKINSTDIQLIKQSYNELKSYRKVARIYNLSDVHVRKIIKNIVWKHLEK